MNLLGLDPGLASMGWAHVQIDQHGTARVLELGVWRTKKSSKKLALRSGSDVARRVTELYRMIEGVVCKQGETGFHAVCMEDFSPPRSASVASKVARVYGMVDALFVDHATFRVTPQEIKRAVAGKISASKEEVENAVRQVSSIWALDNLKANVPASQRNHAFDAAASVLACLEHTEMKLLRRVMA